MQSQFKHIAEEVRRQVDDLLSGLGILCRVFGRGKDEDSLAHKITKEPGKYTAGGKLVQDTIGIRVALYFPEDIDIVKSILCSKYEYDEQSSMIDSPKNDQFAVTRYNLIYRIPTDNIQAFQRIAGDRPIDCTFEVQLRSILSEGWHEVEHDLRYKAKTNWEGQDDLSRALNGVFATLETSEWSMSRIFDELSYRHYKSRNWNGMLQNKLKMRIHGEISQPLNAIFDAKPAVAKEFLRIDRSKLLQELYRFRPRLPLTMDNAVYLWNKAYTKHQDIIDITPNIIKESD
jgi:ppGpp synthetase/RelA/SpoT-type nucleotidyltranferase